MRRKDREITDRKVIEDFIKKEQILRVAFYDEGDIYIVPVNYGYSYDESYTFYFHGAKAGRKYELAKKTPNVGFEIDGNYSLIGGQEACAYSAPFQSVIGTGTLSLVDECKFDNAFTFIFSTREGTPACKLKDNTDLKEKEQRLYRLNEVVNKYFLENNKKLENTVVKVLVEGTSEKKDMYYGYSETNKLINFKKDINHE